MTRTEPKLAEHYDIVIAGGGMVGISLALLLTEYCHRSVRVLVVESFAVGPGPQQSAPVYSPSFDARCTALSYGSMQIFEFAGVWQQLSEHVMPIETIHVSQRGQFGSVVLDKTLMNWPALGCVVENRWLGTVLLAALGEQQNVQLASPATVTGIECRAGGHSLTVAVDGAEQRLSADLLVVADGAQSALRRQLGIHCREKAYEHSAVIANVCFKKPHNGRAYERFTDEGPMALLPLSPSDRGEHRAALVWNLDALDAEELVEIGDVDFLQRLQQRFGDRLGQFIRVGQRDLYPLSLMTAQEQVRQGLVIMGNAAHSLHPVAGQGFNLALRDCARLAETLGDAIAAQCSPGQLGVLHSYLQKQAADQRQTTVFSDQLPALFGSGSWPLSAIRGIGLSALDMLPAIKNPFVRRTAGVFDGAACGVSDDV